MGSVAKVVLVFVTPFLACSSVPQRATVDTLPTIPTGAYSGENDTGPDDAVVKVPIGTSPTRGPADAWVTMVEFADFECPPCGEAEPILSALLEEYSGDLRLVFKNLPLTDIHPDAQGAAIAAECASAQGAFWQMHDLLFANQDFLDGESLPTYAQAAGVDLNAWQQCLSTEPPLDAIGIDVGLATSLGIRGTPTFVINGQRVVGVLAQSQFEAVINAARDRAQASGLPRSQYYDTAILGP